MAPQSVARGAREAGIGQRRGCFDRTPVLLGRRHPAARSHLLSEDTAPPCAVAPAEIIQRFPSSLVLAACHWRMIRCGRQYWRCSCKGREAQFPGWVPSAPPRKPSILENPLAVPHAHKTVPGHPDNSQRRSPPARSCRPAASYIRHIPPFYRSLRIIGVIGF